MLKAVDLHKSFGDLEVLKGINLDVQPSEVVVLVGVSGSGKSSLVSQTIFPLLSKHINNP